MLVSEVVKHFPDICEHASVLVESFDMPAYTFDNIVIAGVGGSAVGGDLIRDLMRFESRIPIEVSRDYHLPAYASKTTLVLCSSHSGNTEETLSQFVDAVKLGCKIISLTSNGKLYLWSKKLKIPLIQLPQGFVPRAALPYLFIPAAQVVTKFLGKCLDIAEGIEALRRIRLTQFDSVCNGLKNSAIAIYGPSEFSGVARRFKNQFNENSKVDARYDLFPELDHNEIVGYETNPTNNNVILLRSDAESPELRARIEATREIIEPNAKEIFEIWASGSTNLSRILSWVYIGDYMSLRLAQLRNVEPEETRTIDTLKMKLKTRLNLVADLERELFQSSTIVLSASAAEP